MTTERALFIVSVVGWFLCGVLLVLLVWNAKNSEKAEANLFTVSGYVGIENNTGEDIYLIYGGLDSLRVRPGETLMQTKDMLKSITGIN